MTALLPAGLRWEAPPPRQWPTGIQAATADWEAIAAALQSRPGQWAIVATRPNRVAAAQDAYKIRMGQVAAFSSRGFDATARTVGGECRVYARYTGVAHSDRRECE